MEKRIDYDWILVFTFAYVAGVGIAPFLIAGFSFAGLFLLIGIALIALRKIYRNGVYRDIFTVVIVISVALSTAVFRYSAKDFHRIPDDLTSRIGDQITLEGVIVDEPKDKDRYIQYILYVEEFDEKILVRSERMPKFVYGDQVLFSGLLSRAEPFTDSYGNTVSYDDILSTRDIYFILGSANGEYKEGGKGNVVRSLLFRAKYSFIEHIDSVIPEPYATLVTGIVFGSDDTLGKDADQMFKTAGITHIIVLSGYNLVLIATIILYVFRTLPLTARTVSAIVSIVLFALMSGGGASVVRASLMACMSLIATAFGRRHLAGRILVVTAGCMLLVNPKLLLYDLGFQLSFIATGALIWLSPYVVKQCMKIRATFGMREIVATSISAHMAVMPLLIYSLHSVSFFGVLANILVLPVVPILMGIAIGIGMLGFIHTSITIPFAYIAWGISVYIFKVAEFFSRIPFAKVEQNYITTIVMIFLYIGFVYWIFPHVIQATRDLFSTSRVKTLEFIRELW